MSPLKIALYATLTLLCIAVILFFADPPQNILGNMSLVDEDGEAIPDAIMRNASTQRYDNDGKLSYTFNAKALRHFRGAGIFDGGNGETYTSVEEPTIVIYRDGSPWRIESKRGHIDQSNIISLYEKVIVHQDNGDGTSTLIETEQLNFDPMEKLALTDEPVTITMPYGTVEAVGMHADINAEKIHLKSKVRGVYVP